MKKIIFGLMLLVYGNAFAYTLPLQTIYTDQCQNAAIFYQLVAQKTNGAIVFNIQCGGYGYSPGGAYLQIMDGTVIVQ